MSQTIVAAANTVEASGFSYAQSFAYDGLNRLVSAAETGGASNEWNQPFAYDALGNRAIVSGTGVYVPYAGFTAQVTSNAPSAVAAIYSNNQWVGMQGAVGATYDLAGNQTGLGAVSGLSYSYDAENRLTKVVSSTVPSVTFGYDGDGRRVQKTVTTSTGNTTTTYAYSASGELLAEYGTGTGTAGTQYVVGDALGSTRLVTDSTGTPVERRDCAPFGEELSAGVGGRDSLFGTGSYPVLGSG